MKNPKKIIRFWNIYIDENHEFSMYWMIILWNMLRTAHAYSNSFLGIRNIRIILPLYKNDHTSNVSNAPGQNVIRECSQVHRDKKWPLLLEKMYEKAIPIGTLI